MKKIIGLIISVIIFIMGGFFVTCGIFLKYKMNDTTEKFDPFSTTSEDNGRFVTGEAYLCNPVMQGGALNMYVSFYNKGVNDKIVGFVVPKSKTPAFEEITYM